MQSVLLRRSFYPSSVSSPIRTCCVRSRGLLHIVTDKMKKESEAFEMDSTNITRPPPSPAVVVVAPIKTRSPSAQIWAYFR